MEIGGKIVIEFRGPTHSRMPHIGQATFFSLAGYCCKPTWSELWMTTQAAKASWLTERTSRKSAKRLPGLTLTIERQRPSQTPPTGSMAIEYVSLPAAGASRNLLFGDYPRTWFGSLVLKGRLRVHMLSNVAPAVG
jgi:hypothetical protein